MEIGGICSPLQFGPSIFMLYFVTEQQRGNIPVKDKGRSTTTCRRFLALLSPFIMTFPISHCLQHLRLLALIVYFDWECNVLQVCPQSSKRASAAGLLILCSCSVSGSGHNHPPISILVNAHLIPLLWHRGFACSADALHSVFHLPLSRLTFNNSAV